MLRKEKTTILGLILMALKEDLIDNSKGITVQIMGHKM
jgi:hypothetical protein